MNFTVLREGRAWGEFFLPMLGTHNAWNGLAALAALAEVGAEPGPLRKALAGFQGVHKRQEVVGEFQGVLVMQDFAHHPTAVAVTLAAVRQGYPARRLLAVFEPRTNTSRRRIFQEAYAAAFKDADLVLVREPPDLWKVEPEEQFSSRQLAADLAAPGPDRLLFSRHRPAPQGTAGGAPARRPGADHVQRRLRPPGAEAGRGPGRKSVGATRWVALIEGLVAPASRRCWRRRNIHGRFRPSSGDENPPYPPFSKGGFKVPL